MFDVRLFQKPKPLSPDEEFYYEAIYEAWRSGHNPDAVHREDTDDCFHSGATPDQCVSRLFRRRL